MLLLTIILLVGCTHVHLYDASKTALSVKAVEQLKEAKLDKLDLTKQQALDDQLAYGVSVARKAGQFLLENDLLKMAASNDKKMDEWRNDAKNKINGLGFPKLQDLSNKQDKIDEINGWINKAAGYRASMLQLLPTKLVKLFPACAPKTSDWAAIDKISNIDDKAAVKFLYPKYKKACSHTLRLTSGVVVAQAELNEFIQRAALQAAEIAKLKREIKEEAPKLGKPPSEYFKAKLTKFSDYIDKLSKGQKTLKISALPESTIDELQVLLTVLQGEELTLDPEKNEVSSELIIAATFAKHIPNLANDAKALLQQGKKIPTSHLIIEMNRQLILAAQSKAEITLLTKRVMLERKIAAAKMAQAEGYLGFITNMCNYVYRKEGVDKDPKLSSCIGEGLQSEVEFTELNDATWSVALTSKGLEYRHIMRAILALAEAHYARGIEVEADLEVSDLIHRRTLLASNSATAQWYNLINVPASQIAAFYEAGIKPQQFSDFIVKITGLVGLAIVAKD
jgi:hypothetical protein